ncbi:hypothetical protein [Luteimonas sp. BLCC-B24]|uniref:hypothetical protein n=1 Tax=Luteimonas sp. BLCC-B24 TaxID=3025317 RepID=UPI00234DE029|nr:hypothetical protein [Luteimonas sp. BLCC-B24]
MQQRDQDVAHVPSSDPTRGPFVAHGMTVWNGDGSIEVARCVSRQLCPAGNAANARQLALGSEALYALADLVAALTRGDEPQAAVQTAANVLQRAGMAPTPARPVELQVAA